MINWNGFQPQMHTEVVRSTDQVSTNLEGDAIVLNVKSGKYFSLNPVGAKIWDLIEKPARIDVIFSHLIDEYNVDEERCKQDLLSILGKLYAAGLILVVESTVR